MHKLLLITFFSLLLPISVLMPAEIVAGTDILDENQRLQAAETVKPQAATEVDLSSPTTANDASPSLPLSITATPAITLTELITSSAALSYPTDIAHAGDGRLFIVEKEGRIRIFDGSAVLAMPFLDITTIVTGGTSDNDESGLLALAFHPDYAANGYFYVAYTFGTSPLKSRIARYKVSAANPNLADPASATAILEFTQDFSNHNSGDLNFGPNDGYLYIGSGDGGSGGDPNNNAQNNSKLLGKILRIDVDGSGGADCDLSGSSNYAIPPANPLADGAGGSCDEIWSSGLRNPWRFSFDRDTGDMWIGDVGQSDWEEIDYQPAAGSGGENWGWRCYEGDHVYNTTGCLPAANYDFPIYEYSSGIGSGNCSVTGGFVYRGAAVTALTGHYIFTDYCSGRFWSLSGSSHTAVAFGPAATIGSSYAYITTFGEDVNGELYLAENGTDASIYKVTAAFLPPEATHYIPLIAG